MLTYLELLFDPLFGSFAVDGRDLPPLHFSVFAQLFAELEFESPDKFGDLVLGQIRLEIVFLFDLGLVFAIARGHVSVHTPWTKCQLSHNAQRCRLARGQCHVGKPAG